MSAPQTPVVGHICPESDERAPALEGPADPTVLATATSWVRQRFPDLPPQVAEALAHSFEAGFIAGGNHTMTFLVAELRAQDLGNVADLVEKRWHS